MRKHVNRTYLFTLVNHKKRLGKALNLSSDKVILDL